MKKVEYPIEQYRAPKDQQEARNHLTDNQSVLVEGTTGRILRAKKNGAMKIFSRSASWRQPMKYGLYGGFYLTFVENGSILSVANDISWKRIRIPVEK